MFSCDVALPAERDRSRRRPLQHPASSASRRVAGMQWSSTDAMSKELRMRSKGRDKTGGTVDKLRGRFEEATGALRGRERSKVKGQARQTKGSTRKKRGHLRDAFRK